MKSIKFRLSGIFNSFRIPLYKNYHKSYIAPPKTALVGFLINIALLLEKDFFQILSSNAIQVSVIVEELGGQFSDLWSYKTLEDGNRGKNIVKREKNYQVKYLVYLKIFDEHLREQILTALRFPKSIPSLGLDDELVHISDVEEIILGQSLEAKCDSIFPEAILINGSENISFNAFPRKLEKRIILPTINNVVVNYKNVVDKKERRTPRQADLSINLYEYYNCQIQFEEMPSGIYFDPTSEYHLAFY